jgi:toxin ParE1/3/4
MMPLRIDRLPQAKRDLFDIWDYLAPHSLKGATGVIGELYAAFSMLSEQPKAGRKRPELGTGLRSFPVAGYSIFYRYSETTLSIVRILHAARDVTPDLLSD